MSEHNGHRDRMRARFLQGGLTGFADHEVLELLLFYALPRRDTNALAHRLLAHFGSLDAVFEAEPEALGQVEGIGENAAVLIRLVPEVTRRYLLAKNKKKTVLMNSEEAGAYLLPYFLGSRKEQVYLLCLDAGLKVIDCRPIGSGGSNSVSIDIQEIAKLSVNLGAFGVVLAHNHTSGIALPSSEDKQTTLTLQQALSILGVRLLDHIIVAGDDFVSMADDGVFDQELSSCASQWPGLA